MKIFTRDFIRNLKNEFKIIINPNYSLELEIDRFQLHQPTGLHEKDLIPLWYE